MMTSKPYDISAFHVVYRITDLDFHRFLVNYAEQYGSPYPLMEVGDGTVTFFVPSCAKNVFKNLEDFLAEAYQKYKHARTVTELIRLYRRKDEDIKLDLDIPYLEV